MDSIALVSLFYANQKLFYEPELEEQSMDFRSWTMVMSIAYATGVGLCFLIHSVGGFSAGILLVLLVLAVVLSFEV
ncbi:hypothetical protein V6N13_083193 [Hibiscus sabdariffa]